MSFSLVETPSRLPEIACFRNWHHLDQTERDLVEIHKQNPGASKEEVLEIMATANGWLY